MNKYKKKDQQNKEIAKERIGELFSEADKIFSKEPKLADRYVYLARKISMKYKVRIPSELKRKFCKHCFIYLMPGKNLRVRLNDSKVVYYCLNCKRHSRILLKKRKTRKQ